MIIIEAVEAARTVARRCRREGLGCFKNGVSDCRHSVCSCDDDARRMMVKVMATFNGLRPF